MSQNAIAAMAVLMVAGFAGCAATARGDVAATVEVQSFPTWGAADVGYRLYPGDEIRVSAPSARELDQTVTIAPDGRVTLPLVGAVMAADRTIAELDAALEHVYAAHLIDPTIEVTAIAFGSQQVFVGGEVTRPGLVDIGAGADAMQAVIQAGGFTESARAREVLILRRTPDGASAVYAANMSADAVRAGLADLGPLQRYDVVYVPRTKVAEVGRFMQTYVREALPIQFGLYYNLADGMR
jgi:polysaccharide export outer membrane protein